MILLLYNLGLVLALAVSAPWWLWQMATTRKYREGLSERLGFVPQRIRHRLLDAGGRRPVIWLHAVSVGEVLAVSRLAAEVDAALPEYLVLISTTTRTGQALARERDLTGVQAEEMAAAALAVLADVRFAAVFGPGSRAEVALAGRSTRLPDGMAVSGRVDRLVVTSDRVLVIDFKTNRPAPKRIEDADAAYVRQTALYWAVLTEVYPDRPVEAALVWTDGPALMPVPQALMAAALEVLV